MKLQVRFLAVLLIIFIAIGGLVVVQHEFDIQRTKHVLNSELSNKQESFKTNITSEGQAFQTFSEDYSFWDDMVAFVKNDNVTFAHVNLDSGLSTFGADEDWVYKPNGSLLYTSTVSPDTKAVPLNLSSDFFQSLRKTKFAHFYEQTPNGTFEIRAATIVPGTDAKHLDPASGYWIIGRYLGTSFVNQMAKLSQSTVELVPTTTSSSNTIAGDLVSFIYPLKDSSGHTIQLIRSTSRVTLVDDLDTIYHNELVVIGLFGFIILAIILSTISLLVLRPLALITKSIQKKRPNILNRIARTHSEFGYLANIVQQFFNQKLIIEEDTFIKTELERLNEEKMAFLSVAAHELKAPSTIIKLIAQDLPTNTSNFKKQDPREIMSELEIILHQANKMTALVRDIRSAAQGRTEIELTNSTFDFDKFLHQEVSELGYVLDQKLTIEGKTGQTIIADEEHLSQVVSNLLRNAAKYAPDTKEIMVKSHVRDDQIVVEVQDFGVGISSEDQKHIFERYFRSERVAKTFQGLGLGLSICKEIIERMGGSIWVESTLGKGTQFFFSVPIQPPEQTPQKNSANSIS